MDKLRVDELLNIAVWKYARTIPKHPHDYSLRHLWINDNDFVDVVLFIRENGVMEKFYNTFYTYYYSNGYKYWTMGNPVSYIDKSKTFILNRAKV